MTPAPPPHQGMLLDSGYFSSQQDVAGDTNEIVLSQALVLIHPAGISSAAALQSVLALAREQRRSLLIVTEEVLGEALLALIEHAKQQRFACVAVGLPGFGEKRSLQLEDLAIATGAKVVAEASDDPLKSLTVEELGRAQSVVVTRSSTTLSECAGDETLLVEHMGSILKQMSQTSSNYDQEQLSDRLENLKSGLTPRAAAQLEEQLSGAESRARAEMEPQWNEPWSALRIGRNVGLFWVALLLLGFGLGLYLVGRRSIERASQSANWPSTSGEILSSKVVRKSVSSVGNKSHRTSHRSQVTYRYSVNDERFTGHRVRFGDGTGGTNWDSQDRAKQIVARYPVGKSVRVYYDPSKHSQAVLEPGKKHVSPWAPRFGLVLLMAGGALLLVFAACRIVLWRRKQVTC